MKSFRRLLELWARGKIFTRTLVVHGQPYPIKISPDAQLKYMKLGDAKFDCDLVDIAEAFVQENSIVWDVGANVGVFTFTAAAIATKGTVVSIEADAWLAGLLRQTRNLLPYRDKDVRVVPVALSESNGIATFQISARGRASNALEIAGGRSQMGGVREKQYVPTLTMDTLLASLPAPDFVKIDVEGAEVMVVEGAEKLMREVRPIFYIEVGPSASKDIIAAFKQVNFEIYSQVGEHLIDTCTNDTFFVPIEKVQYFEESVQALN